MFLGFFFATVKLVWKIYAYDSWRKATDYPFCRFIEQNDYIVAFCQKENTHFGLDFKEYIFKLYDPFNYKKKLHLKNTSWVYFIMIFSSFFTGNTNKTN